MDGEAEGEVEGERENLSSRLSTKHGAQCTLDLNPKLTTPAESKSWIVNQLGHLGVPNLETFSVFKKCLLACKLYEARVYACLI